MEYETLKKWEFTTHTVKIEKSKVALRRWRVEVTSRYSDPTVRVLSSDVDAWRCFYDEARRVIDEESRVWFLDDPDIDGEECEACRISV